jgi:hypothetical protein
MAGGEETKAMAWRALWHVGVAFRLLQRLDRRLDPNSAAEPEAKSLLRAAAEPLGLPTLGKKEAGKSSPDSLMSLLRERMIDQVREADAFTNDVVEIRGRLGAEDNRELKINGRPPLKLDHREHSVLLILAYFARYVAEGSRASKKRLSAFVPVNSIVAIIDKLTSAGGSLSGRWLYPVDVEIRVSSFHSSGQFGPRQQPRSFGQILECPIRFGTSAALERSRYSV